MSLFKSKKFWAAVVGLIAVPLTHFLGVDEAVVMSVGGTIIAYILGQGLSDIGKEAAKVE